MSTLAGPTKGAEKTADASEQWEARPGLARALRFGIFAAPLLVSILFTWMAGRIAPPESLGMNRWVWIGCVFVLANVLLALLRKATSRLVPLVALMKLTLVFPDQAPSRTKATLRQSNSRRLLREIEEAEKRGEDSSEIRYADYLVQLLKELNDHDRLTRGHSERVRVYAEMIGEEIGLSDDEMNKLRWSALLHDVGKLSVPAEILNSPGRPTDEEWKVLSGHPASAVPLLAPLEDWLGDWVHSADQHHCRWDGKGYPYDLAGTDISLAGRLVAIADAYDVMTSTRSYKKPLPVEVARQELTDCAGGQFDPSLVRSFLRISLGRLRFVGGPLAWLANLTGSFQIPVPVAGSVTSTVWSTGVAAAGMAVASTTGAFVETPPELLSFSEPVVVAYDSEQTTIEGDEQAVTLLVSSTGSDLVITLGAPENGTATITREAARRTPGFSAIAEDDWLATVVYSPAPGFQGIDRFSFQACTDDECDTAEVTITVVSTNEAPTVGEDEVAVNADQPVRIDVLANDIDPDGDDLDVVAVTPAENGVVSIVDGQVDYVPNPGFTGIDTFSYTIEDPEGEPATATVIVTVIAEPEPEPLAPPAEPPATANDSGDGFATSEDVAFITGSVLANDDGASLDAPPTVTVTTQPQSGSLQNNGDGTFWYSPLPDFNGEDTFLYTIESSDGLVSENAIVTIVVLPVADAPQAVDDAGEGFSVDEGQVLTTADVTANDTDVDGELAILRIDLVSEPSQGSVVNNGDGTFEYAPDDDASGTDSFEYVLVDTDGLSSVAATVTIRITGVNDAPVAVDDEGAGYTVLEDNWFVTGNVLDNDSDVDSDLDPESIVIVQPTTDGELISLGDGTFRYTPDPDVNGTDTFTYTIADADGAVSAEATVTIVIRSVNDGPIAAADGGAGFSTDEDTAFTTADVTANDVDGEAPADPTTTQIADEPSHGTIVNNGDGTFTYTPDADFNGIDTFSYAVADTDGVLSPAVTVTLVVNAINDPLVLNPDAGAGFETIEDVAFVTASVLANDVDPDVNDVPAVDPAPADDAPADDDLPGKRVGQQDVLPYTIDITVDAEHGQLVNNSDGTFAYEPDANFSGTDTFSYTVTDAEGVLSEPGLVTLTVVGANDVPVANDDSYVTQEDVAFTTDVVTANDTDVEDDTLAGATVELVDAPGLGSVVSNGDGTFTYTPDADVSGVDSFSYTVADGDGARSLPAQVTVVIEALNDAPVAADDAFVTQEDTAFTTADVTVNDADVDDAVDAASVAVVAGPTLGALSSNGDGTFTYTPNANVFGSDSFSYTITDASGTASAPAVVTITIAAVNDVPVANGDSFQTQEDTAFTTADVTANDTDVEDDTLSGATVELVDAPALGAVVSNGDGTFTYTPDADVSGVDSFSYTVTDASGAASAPAVVTVTVTAVNDAPVANDDSFATDEDTAFTTGVVTANDTDVDDAIEAASVEVVAAPSLGAVVSNGDGTFTYTPDADVSGVDSFSYTVTDASGETSAPAAVTVTVTAVNDAPVANDDAYETFEDLAFTTGNVTRNDSDVEDATLSGAAVELVDAASFGTVTSNGDGTFDYAPDADANGTDTFTYRVLDSDAAASELATVTITVRPGNDPPVAENDGGLAFTTAEDTGFTTPDVAANDSDIEDGTLDGATAVVLTGVTNGSLVSNGDGTFSYTPDADFFGTDSFTYIVNDTGLLASNEATVTITVTPVNDAPDAGNDAGAGFSTNEDEKLETPNVLTNDSDIEDATIDPASLVVTGDVANGALDYNGDGTFVYTPNPHFNGTDVFRYTVFDGDGEPSNKATVTIEVLAVNDIPVAADDAGPGFAGTEDTDLVTVSVLDNDTDVEDLSIDPATLTIVASPVQGQVIHNGDGTFTYTPDPDINGQDTFAYVVADAEGALSAPAVVTVEIAPVNDAPVAQNDSGAGFETAEDTSFTTANVLDNDTDVEDATLDPATLSLESDVANGTLANNGDGTFTYTPFANTNGADSFSYTVTDADGVTSAPATVSLNVVAVNDPPVAQDNAGPAFTTDEDTAFTTPNVASNDSDTEDGAIDPATVTLVDSVSSGTLTNNGDGTFDFEPEADATGIETFTYTVTDSLGAVSDTAEVTMTIRPINDAPVAVDDAGVGFTGPEDTVLVTANILTNDSDVEDPALDPATIVVTSPVSFGTLDSNGDGTFDYTPNLNFDGDDQFTYIIEDSGGLASNPATVTLSMIAGDDPPVAVDDGGANFVTDEDTTLVLPDITANDSDPEDGAIARTAVTVIDQPTNGTLDIADDGTISYIPNENVFGPDSFTYKASDSSLLESNLATVTLEVLPVNDDPVAADDAGVGFNVDEDTTLTTPNVTLNDSDVEDGAIDPVTAILVGNAVNGTATSNGDGTFDFTPDDNFVGAASFTYIVTDSDGASSAPTEVQIVVLPVNDPPVAVNDSGPEYNLEEDVVIVFGGNVLSNDTDVEDATLLPSAIEVLTEPAKGDLINNGDGTFGYIPDDDSNGTDSFTYRVADSEGAWSEAATVAFFVRPVNDAPVAGDDSGVGFATDENTAFTTASVTDNDSDIEDGTIDPATVSVVAGPTDGVLTNNGDGTFDYAPTGDFNGQDSFTYTVEDADGELSAPATVTIIVEPVNDPPVANDDGGADFTTDEDTGFTTPDLTANDSDPEDGSVDPASVVIVSNPAHGLLLDNGDGTFVYTPTRNYNGNDSFTYRVEDSEGLASNAATVTIVIEPINDAPEVATPPTQELVIADPYSLQIEVTDVESDSVAFSASGLPPGFSLSSSGVISGAVPAGGEGQYDVTINVSDAGSPPETTTITFEMLVRGWSVSALEGSVVITEILPVATLPPTREFVEITNAGTTPIDLAGWRMLDFNLRVEGAGDLNFTFGETDASGDPSVLQPGEQAVVWLGSDASASDPDEGLEYVINDGTYKLGNSGDDVWLLDPERRIVDYVAFDDGSEVGVAPPAELGLWDDTFQAQLVATIGRSLVLTPHGVDSNSSACWELTASDNATGRCADALPTFDIDGSDFVTSVGMNNNAFEADAGGEYEIVQGEDLTLDASGTPSIATGYAWDLDGDDDFGDASGVAPTVTWDELVELGLESPGEYEISLDAQGSIALAGAKLTILDDGEVIAATGASTSLAGMPYSLTLKNDDQGTGGFVEWTVNWGDGAIEVYSSPDGSPITVDHTYNGPGLTYDILVSGKDSNGVVYFDNNLIVPSFDKDKLYVYDEAGGFVDDPATLEDAIEAEFGPDGLIYVSSEKDGEVRRHDPETGAFIDTFVPAGTGGMDQAGGLAFGPYGDLFVANQTDSNVLRFDGSTGALIGVFAATGLVDPYDIVFDSNTNMYVNDYNTHEVRRYNSSTGVLIDVFVAGEAGTLKEPEQMAFGPDGNLYVASFNNHKVLRFSGIDGSYIDTFIDGGSGDNDSGNPANLHKPTGIAFGPDGNLYVADHQDHSVLRYDGTTGAFIDEFVAEGEGGITKPDPMTFAPTLQVTIS